MEHTISYTRLKMEYGKLKQKYEITKKQLAIIKKANEEMQQLIQPIRVSPDKLLIKAIQSEFQYFKEEHLKLRSRKREVVLCRQIFAHLLRKKTGMEWVKIGALLGQDHSTAIHSFHTIANLIDYDKQLLARLERIERIFMRYHAKG